MEKCVFCNSGVADTSRCPKCKNLLISGQQGMVYVPSGNFIIGDNDLADKAFPEREIFLPGYFIDVFPVTNREYRDFDSSFVYRTGADNHPVSGVTWYEAVKYAERKGKRLPSEEEWEKAARGGDRRKYPWGNVFKRNTCNYKRWGGLWRTTPVGRFPEGKSPYGCMDMSGNVWEWTSSSYDSDARVLKGGGWSSPSKKFLRIGYRLRGLPKSWLIFGFRCAL